MSCPYLEEFTDEETVALTWIKNVTDRIIEKGPKHRSYQNAVNLQSAITKLLNEAVDMHDELHAMERRIEAFTDTITMKRADA